MEKEKHHSGSADDDDDDGHCDRLVVLLLRSQLDHHQSQWDSAAALHKLLIVRQTEDNRTKTRGPGEVE